VQRARREGVSLPPIEIGVFQDGSGWIVDGNHRLVAARRAKDDSIEVIFTFVPTRGGERAREALDPPRLVETAKRRSSRWAPGVKFSRRAPPPGYAEQIPPEVAADYDWFEGTVPLRQFFGTIIGDNGYEVSLPTVDDWEEWMRIEEEEGYDFDAVNMAPVTVTYDEDGFTLWDGWHRTALHVIDGSDVAAIIGTPRP